MADKKAVLEATLDSTGVETGANQGKAAINSLGEAAVAAGEKGSKGLDKIAVSGDAAAKKLAATNRSLVNEVQRNIALIEAGASVTPRLTRQYAETMVRLRGASADVLKPYLQQLDEAIAKQQRLSAVEQAAAQQAKQRAVEAAKALRAIEAPNFTTSLGATDFARARQSSVVLPRPSAIPNFGTALGATAFGEIAEKATKAKDAVSDFDRRFGAAGLTAQQTTAALRQVPAQFTDIIISLQGGQNPLTVLLQQGGQLKDVFGGIGPAARALGSYVLGLVNPFTLAAGAVGALGYAYYRGTEQQDAFARSLILSGNAVGSTVSQLSAMATAISANVGTYGQASEALTKFAADGNVAAGKLEDVARAAVRLQQVGGPAVDQLVQQFAALAKEPLQASLKLNESTRFLTRSTYDQIKALEESGRAAEAAAVAQTAYLDVLEDRGRKLEDRLGNIERLWLRIKKATLEPIDALAGLLAPTPGQTLEKEISKLKDLEELNRKVRSENKVPTDKFTENLERQRDLVDGLKQQAQVEVNLANAQAEGNKKLQDRIRFEAILKRNEQDKGRLLDKEIEAIRNAGANGIATDDEINRAIAGARERFKTGKKGDSALRGIDRSELQFDLSAIKADADKLVGIYADAERTLETLRSAGLVDESDYYQAKREFLERTTQAQEEAFQREIQRLNKEKLQGKDKIDNDRKIAEAEAKLAILRASATSKDDQLRIQQEQSLKRIAAAYLAARQAAEEYYSNQVRQQQRSLSAIGEGPREQVRNAGIAAIEDDFARQRQALEFQRARLEAENKFGNEAKKQYENQLAIIREFQAKSIASFEAYYQRILELQGDAAVGASRAVKTYIDEAANVAGSTEQFLNNTFQGLEDSLTSFITTGKANFKDFANAIVADITRIIIKQQIANALAGQFGSFDSGGAFSQLFLSLMGNRAGSAMSSGAFGIGLQGFANGGYVERGRVVEVNERNGPGELFNVGGRQYLLASQAGYISPQQGRAADRPPVVVNQNFAFSGAVDRRTQSQVAAMAGRGVQVAMARNG